jgi:hypothetical protein
MDSNVTDEPRFTEPETLALIERINASSTEKMSFEDGLRTAQVWAEEEMKPWYKKAVTWKWIIGLTAATGIGVGGYYALRHTGIIGPKARRA